MTAGVDSPYWVAWHQVRGIGPHRIKRLQQRFGSLATAWEADEQALLEIEGIGLQLALTIQQDRQALDPEDLWTKVLKPGIPVLTPADPSYPSLLWELPDPPPMLYVLGHHPVWHPTVAIVGTRTPTQYGRRWTDKIATALAEAGFVVVSGMAAGVDGVAHQACLKAGGLTLAVLGTGVDRVYPTLHRQLYQHILDQGAVVSEFPPGTPPAKEHFPRRNRIIAGLCQATLVMEAPAKSGALITAYLANDYNRDVFVLPGTIETEAAVGCLRLVQKGASLILSIEELLADLGADKVQSLAAHSKSKQINPQVELTDLQQLIWQALGPDPVSLDAIAQVTQLDISTLSSELLMMELSGVITQVPGLRYQKTH